MIPSLDKRLSERLSRVYIKHMDLQRMPIDTSTSFGRDCLKRRLQRLSKIMIKRAAQRQQQKGVARRPIRRVSYDTFDSRYQVLKCIVGPDMFKELHAVSQEINSVRNSSVLWTKFTPQNPPISSFQKKCDEVSLAECKIEEKEEEQEEDRLPLSKILPAPIADIYFKTHLVERMQASMTSSCESFIKVGGVELMINSDCNCRCIVHRTAWNDLLRDSKTILAAYKKFEAEN